MLRVFFFLITYFLAFFLTPVKFALANEISPEEKSEGQSGYVGSKTCARCHANTVVTFMQTSHPNILRKVEENIILGNFTSSDPDLTFSQSDVKWVIGGIYKQRYLTEIERQLFVLPAEWNIVNSEWVAYETENWRSRPYSKYCAGCHTTGFDADTQTWVEPGVKCEACHGPGADHVASTGNRTKIVNPAKLEFQDQVEVCAQCHSRGTDPSGEFPFPIGYQPGGPAKLHETFLFSTDVNDFWPDGTAKKHHMQYHDWRAGVHSNSVSCIFCHTPHSVGETDHQTRMVGNDRCLICHEGQIELSEHIPFMSGAIDKVNCTDCHMPQISKLVQSDFQIQSHTFRPPNPALSIAYGGTEQMPNACISCHEDQTPEWAASILGQDLPSTKATRVAPPTPIPVSLLTVPSLIELNRNEVINPKAPQSNRSNLFLGALGIILLISLLIAIYSRRKVNLV